MYNILMEKDNKIVIYQAKNGALELRGDIKSETIWATQAQIAQVFNVERSVITKHVNNLFKDKEIEVKSNVQKMHILLPTWYGIVKIYGNTRMSKLS